jgi:hypothetical protein
MNALPPPSVLEQRIDCSVKASVKYQIPANMLLGVAELENGRPGRTSQNENGTVDIGVMQFNSSYIASLGRFGIHSSDVAGSDCYPFDLAAWRLAGHLARDKGDIWTRASNYHSRTPWFNAIYRKKLMRLAAKWETWLRDHYEIKLVSRE